MYKQIRYILLILRSACTIHKEEKNLISIFTPYRFIELGVYLGAAEITLKISSIVYYFYKLSFRMQAF